MLVDSITTAVWLSISRLAASAAARRVAEFRYSSSISTEIEFRPARIAATAVDPEPENGSRKDQPLCQFRRKRCWMSSTETRTSDIGPDRPHPGIHLLPLQH